MSLDDYSMTDIGEVTSDFVFNYEHATEVEYENDEVLITDENGNMKTVGTHVFSPENQIEWEESSGFTIQQQEYVEKTSCAVGKIYVYCYPEQNADWEPRNAKIFTGSAIRVSDSMLLTAHHVIRNERKHKSTETMLYVSRIFVTFNVDGRLNRQDRDLSKARGYYECEKVRSDIDQLFPECYKLKQYLRKEQWSFPNDFCFMKFKSTAPDVNIVPYCLPIVPDTNAPSMIIGYPGFISSDNFYRKYTQGMDYNAVSKMMDGFDKKILSLGKASSIDCEHVVLRHDCQTLGGTSGCLFVHIMEECPEMPYFSAVHIGGDEKMNNNFAISVTQREFLVEYARQVLKDKQFFVKHGDHLQQLYTPKVLETVAKYVPELQTHDGTGFSN